MIVFIALELGLIDKWHSRNEIFVERLQHSPHIPDLSLAQLLVQFWWHMLVIKVANANFTRDLSFYKR